MRIVEATTERLTTAHFGDFTSSPAWSHSWWSNSPLAESQAFQGSIAPALAAIQLEESLAGEYDKFLQATSLDEIMKKHGITCGVFVGHNPITHIGAICVDLC